MAKYTAIWYNSAAYWKALRRDKGGRARRSCHRAKAPRSLLGWTSLQNTRHAKHRPREVDHLPHCHWLFYRDELHLRIRRSWSSSAPPGLHAFDIPPTDGVSRKGNLTIDTGHRCWWSAYNFSQVAKGSTNSVQSERPAASLVFLTLAGCPLPESKITSAPIPSEESQGRSKPFYVAFQGVSGIDGQVRKSCVSVHVGFKPSADTRGTCHEWVV